MFFDYKSHQTQTAVDVSMSLLKQLIFSVDQSDAAIESLYSENKRPDMATCKRLLTCYAQKRDSVYTVFDALDEYNEAPKERSELFGLFGHLQRELRCHLLLSSRARLGLAW